MDEPRQTFKDVLKKFVEENRLKPTDRELLTHDELEPGFPRRDLRNLPEPHVERITEEAQARRDRAAMAIDLLAIRATERQADSQDRHASAMRWLSLALVVLGAVQTLSLVEGVPFWYRALAGFFIFLVFVGGVLVIRGDH